MSKESKYYESLRQTQLNMFNDGLNMDLHPLTTPNTILTDCVNGTMITYNDNEFVLQNARGNTITKARLSNGFIPVAIKEHNNILYLISYNDNTKSTEIGTYPAPVLVENYNNYFSYYEDGPIFKNDIEYTEINSNITYYNVNLKVSSQDKYELKTINDNKLFILEHYILSESGKIEKIILNNSGRFSNKYSGILGYKYRPLYLQEMNVNFTPVVTTKNASLYVELKTDDQDLISKLKTDSNINLECEVKFYLTRLSDKKQIYLKSEILDFPNLWNEYSFTFNTLEIKNLLSSDEVFDWSSGVIIKNDQKYDHIQIEVIPKIKSHDLLKSSSIIMDNLIKTYRYEVSKVFSGPEWFDQFTYNLVKDNDDNYEIDVNINLVYKNFDPTWNENKVYNVDDASFKLYLINNNGLLEGQEIKIANSYRGYDITEAKNVNGLVSADGTNGISIKELTLEQNCQTYNYNNNIKTLQFLVSTQGDNYWNVGSAENFGIFSTCDVVEEQINSTCAHYIINNLQVQKDKVYLLELIFNINNTTYSASFIMITSKEMLETSALRKDQLTLENWYHPKININHVLQNDTTLKGNESYDTNNIFSEELLKSIENADDNESIDLLAWEFFKKYNQLIDVDKSKDEVPSISIFKDLQIDIANDCEYSSIIKNPILKSDSFEDVLMMEGLNKINIKYPQSKKISAIINSSSEIKEQKSQRKYLYNIFKNDIYNIDIINEQVFWIDTDIPDTVAAYHIKNFGRAATVGHRKDWAQDTTKMKSIKYDTEIKRGGCVHTFAKQRSIDILTNVKHDESASLQVMRILGFKNGISYGKVVPSEHVYFNNTNKSSSRAWLIGAKNNDLTKRYLIGYEIDEETFNTQWDAFLKHTYYNEYVVSKRVQQYTYKNECEEIDNIFPSEENLTINCRLSPSYILAETRIPQTLNVQSWNNLKGDVTVTKSINTHINFNVNSDNYKNFLVALVKYINSFTIPEDFSDDASNELKWDADLTYLVSDNKETIQINKPMYIPFRIDTNKNIIYDSIGDIIEGFSYVDENCLDSLNWNFKQEWPITLSMDDAKLLDKYKHILFYKLENDET